MKDQKTEYSKAIADRLQLIMEITDLDVPGFAEFFERSTPHIYGILNRNRSLSEVFAKDIGEKLDFDGAKIFNLNVKIPALIAKSEALRRFKIEYRDNPEYFLSTKTNRSVDTFVSEVLLKSDCFNNGYKYLSEVTEYCQSELNREFIDDKLSKGLRYAVSKNLLKSKKKPIKLKKDGFGKRLVDVYYL